MEERVVKRVPFHVKAYIHFDSTDISGEVENLSTSGMLIKTGESAPLDTLVEVVLSLTGTTTELKLNFLGRVIRSDAEGIALQFTEIDLDAYIHLKNIVVYNSSDSAGIIREFEDAFIDTSVSD